MTQNYQYGNKMTQSASENIQHFSNLILDSLYRNFLLFRNFPICQAQFPVHIKEFFHSLRKVAVSLSY